jgi:hypothetical protein
MARSLAASSFDFGDYLVETILIAAAAQSDVITVLRKAFADMATNTGPCSDYHANVRHSARLYLII